MGQALVTAVGVGLAGFALAARELPESAVALVVGPLADEEVVAARDDGGDDADSCHSERSAEGAESRNRAGPARGAPLSGRQRFLDCGRFAACARNDTLASQHAELGEQLRRQRDI